MEIDFVNGSRYITEQNIKRLISQINLSSFTGNINKTQDIVDKIQDKTPWMLSSTENPIITLIIVIAVITALIWITKKFYEWIG